MSVTLEILNEAELAGLATADEAAVIGLVALEHSRALVGHAEYAEWIDNIDPYVCRRAELINAIRTAPNSLIRQHLYAVYVFRIDISLVSGRSFP